MPPVGPPLLPRSSPAAQGFDVAAVERLLDEVSRADIELHSLLLLRHGTVIAEGWWFPYSPPQRHLLYSISKSVTALAAGFAIAEGLIDPDRPVVELFAEFLPERPDDRFRRMTLRHALTMATGHRTDPYPRALAECRRSADPELLRGLFAVPPTREPGTVFTYNQLATYCVARAVEKFAGTPLIDYLGPRLFAPLGITEQAWMSWNGGDIGFSGLFLRSESLAAIGQLLLQRGRWGDRQLLPADWIDEATSVQMSNDPAHRADPAEQLAPSAQLGYGFQFWKSRIGYRAAGAYGQLVLVWPEHDMVVVTTGACEETPLADLLIDTLEPGVREPGEPARPDAAARERRVRDRLAGLALAGPAGGSRLPLFTGLPDSAAGAAPAGGPVAGGSAAGDSAVGGFAAGDDAAGADAAGVDGVVFCRSGAATAVPELRTVTLMRRSGRWQLATEVAGLPLVIPLAPGQWLRGDWSIRWDAVTLADVFGPRLKTRGTADTAALPFFAAAGRHPDGTVEVWLEMVGMGHTLQLRLASRTRTFEVAWQPPPLRGPSPADHAVDG